MNICDKCKKYNKCFPVGLYKNADEKIRKAEIMLGGCPNYKELTIEEMFGLNKGTLSEM